MPINASFVTPYEIQRFIANRNTSDGMHAVAGWENNAQGNSIGILYVWRSLQDIRKLTLNNWQFVLNGACAFCGDNTLVVVGNYRPGSLPPIKVAEYTLTTDFDLTLTKEFALFTDESNRDPKCYTLNDETLVVVSYRLTGPQCIIDVAYRNLAGVWNVQTQSFNVFSFIPSSKITICQNADNSVWVFISRDSSSVFYVARFMPDGVALNFMDFTENFLSAFRVNGSPADGDMSPGDEFPDLLSRYDSVHNRILLFYPKTQADWRCGSSFEYPVITACYPDMSKELIAVLPSQIDSKAPSGPGWIFVHGNKTIDYLIYANDPTSCENHWQMGYYDFRLSKIIPSTRLPYKISTTSQISASEDGWTAFIYGGRVNFLLPFPLIREKLGG